MNSFLYGTSVPAKNKENKSSETNKATPKIPINATNNNTQNHIYCNNRKLSQPKRNTSTQRKVDSQEVKLQSYQPYVPPVQRGTTTNISWDDSNMPPAMEFTNDGDAQ